MHNIYFISDMHFHHNNIIDFANRPFFSVEEMNIKMIENWNSVVKNDDIVYHLGDFSMKSNKEEVNKILNQLNGNIILVKGNHDKVGQYRYIEADIVDNDTGNTIPLVMFHYPIQSWNKQFHGSIHVHGHEHSKDQKSGMYDDKKRIFNCCVEAIEYTPISLKKILEHFGIIGYNNYSLKIKNSF